MVSCRRCDDWEREVDWADVIVFDDTLGQGEKAQALRARGKAVIGGTPYTDRLEDDRSFGQEELKKAGHQHRALPRFRQLRRRDRLREGKTRTGTSSSLQGRPLTSNVACSSVMRTTGRT